MIKYLDIAIANETIKTTDIKGKEYAEVNQRIKAFRMVYPNGTIETEMISNENGVCIFKAKVGYTTTIFEDDKIRTEYTLLGTGTAYEKEDSSFINKTSYIENCETSAVGRALGMAGFGIDVSVASAEEVQNAIMNQEMTEEDAKNYKFTFGRNEGKTLKEVQAEDPKYIEWVLNNSKDERILKAIELELGIKIPTQEEQIERLKLIANINDLAMEKDIDIEEVKEKFKVNDLKEMTTEQMKKCIEAMEKKNNE